MKTLLFGANPDDLGPEQLDTIRSLVPDMHILVSEDKAEIEAVIADVEIAARRFPHGLLPKAQSLRWMQQLRIIILLSDRSQRRTKNGIHITNRRNRPGF